MKDDSQSGHVDKVWGTEQVILTLKKYLEADYKIILSVQNVGGKPPQTHIDKK